VLVVDLAVSKLFDFAPSGAIIAFSSIEAESYNIHCLYHSVDL
jgi:hypothetical protein